MPKISGVEMTREFMGIRSDMPIFFCTETSERITEEKVGSVGIKAFISEAGTNVRDSQDYPQMLDQEIEVFRYETKKHRAHSHFGRR